MTQPLRPPPDLRNPDLRSPDLRTVEILDRIKAVFAAKGFDGASMQDLARAATMSAGNFYRYFPSKSAIIEALIERDLVEVQDDFRRITQARDPLATMREVLARRLASKSETDGPLWAEIEAASARGRDVSEIAARMQNRVMEHLLRVFAHLAGTTEAEAVHRFTAHARMLMVLVKGSATCGLHGYAGGGDQEAYQRLVMRLVDQILSEVSGGGPEGAPAAIPSEPEESHA